MVSPTGQVLYRGRIDDRYAGDGKRRDEPTTADLQGALDAVLAGEAPAAHQTGRLAVRYRSSDRRNAVGPAGPVSPLQRRRSLALVASGNSDGSLGAGNSLGIGGFAQPRAWECARAGFIVDCRTPRLNGSRRRQRR